MQCHIKLWEYFLQYCVNLGCFSNATDHHRHFLQRVIFDALTTVWLSVKTAWLSETNMVLHMLPYPTSPQTRTRWKGKQPVLFALSSLSRVNGAAPCLWPDFGLPACLAKGPIVVEREGPFLEAKWELSTPHAASATKTQHMLGNKQVSDNLSFHCLCKKKKGWPGTLKFEAEFTIHELLALKKTNELYIVLYLSLEVWVAFLSATTWIVMSSVGKWAVLSGEWNVH